MKIQQGISLKPLSKDAKAASQEAHLKDAAQMYENHFLNQMVKAMRSTVGQEDGLVKKNMAEKIFSEQLDQQYVEGWAKKGGVGLADMIYTQIKEKYYGSTDKQIRGLNHMLPISPKKEPHGLSSPDSIKMKMIPPANGAKLGYRFEVENPSSGGFEVQAPMPGKVSQIDRLDHGWNTLKLDHGQGLTSELTFPGQMTELGLDSEVETGQRLGVLDSSRPALAWNLDWT